MTDYPGYLRPSAIKTSLEASKSGLDGIEARLHETIVMMGDVASVRLDRAVLAVYDEYSDMLSVLAEWPSNPDAGGKSAILSDSPTLSDAVAQRQAVIGDLSKSSDRCVKGFTARFGSCAMIPVRDGTKLCGMIFLTALKRDFFNPSNLTKVQPYTFAMCSLLMSETIVARMLGSAISLVSTIGRFRDKENGAHVERVAGYSAIIARNIDLPTPLSSSEISVISHCSKLHDMGEIAIPDRILFKESPLTDEEAEVMRGHVHKGIEMVDMVAPSFGPSGKGVMQVLRNIVGHHHERFDGTGYPEGMAGDGIPLEARIVAVADSFDSLTSERPWRRARGLDEALVMLKADAGTAYDPSCVDALSGRRDEIRRVRDTYRDI